MKNKILISITLVASFNIAQAEYSAKIFIDGLSFKNETQTPVLPPSTNCIYDSNNNRMGVKNISENTSPYGIGIGESAIYYNTGFIGRDTATQNFPAGLTLGDYVESLVGFGYDLHKICADDFSIYPDLDNPPAPSYTYNEINIPNGSFGSVIGDNGYQIFGFVEYSATVHPEIQNFGNPISSGNGNRLMLKIYEHEQNSNYPLVMLYIVNGNEGINDSSNPGNIEEFWEQYDRIILSNSDESFKIEFPNNGSVLGNWADAGEMLSAYEIQQIKNNPNIITKIKFRNKQ